MSRHAPRPGPRRRPGTGRSRANDARRTAGRTAFRNCTIFFKLYEASRKGVLLEQQGLGNRAVHAFGVSASSVSKFVSSFVDSAVAAGMAEVSEDGRLTLLEPDDDVAGPDEAAASATPSPATAYATVGEVVASLERLSLTHAPSTIVAATEDEATG